MARTIVAFALLLLLASAALPAGESTGVSGRPAASTSPGAVADAEVPADAVRTLLRRPGYPGAQVGIIRQIEAKQRVEYLPELLQLVRDEHPEVRQAAAQALGTFGWERISGPMVRLLADKTEPVYARELAARTLAGTGRREVVEPLLALLDDPALAPAAVKGLGEITMQDLPDAEAWRRWWDENRTRSRTEWAAARVDELKQRIAQMERDRDGDRKRAAEIEGRLGEVTVRFLDARADRNDPAPLIAALDVPSGRVRRYAATELGKLKAKDAAAKLSELATGTEDAALRADCASALGEIGLVESVALLGQLLSDPSETVAASAALALGRMKAQGATNRLLMGLLHPSATVRAASAEALGRIGGTAGVVPLGELLGVDQDASVRERAARALGEIGDARSRAALEKALGDESPAVRVYAAESLGRIGVPEVAARLGAALESDPSPSVRESAAVALGKVGGKDALTPLARALDRKDDKLASLAWSSILAVCRRDDALAGTTADAMARAGKLEQATALYEGLERSLVEKKDEVGLIAVRVKLADGLVTQKQWAKAAGVLENLVRTLPDDVPLAEKYAVALSGMGRRNDALRVYQALAARQEAKPYWDERLALLEAMLAEKKTDEVAKAVDAALRGDDPPADDVRKKLEDLRRRCEPPPAEKAP